MFLVDSRHLSDPACFFDASMIFQFLKATCRGAHRDFNSLNAGLRFGHGGRFNQLLRYHRIFNHAVCSLLVEFMCDKESLDSSADGKKEISTSVGLQYRLHDSIPIYCGCGRMCRLHSRCLGLLELASGDVCKAGQQKQDSWKRGTIKMTYPVTTPTLCFLGIGPEQMPRYMIPSRVVSIICSRW